MTTKGKAKDVIKKVQQNGRDLANKGSEVVEKAYKTTVDILSQAKHDGPELITNLVKKGETEWDEARKVVEKVYKENADKLKSLQQDLFKALEEIRDRVVKEMPIDLSYLQDLLKKIEETIGKLDIPFLKKGIAEADFPIRDYDELSVKKIVPQLGGLTLDKLAQVLKYEQANQKRVSLTREIEKLLKAK